MESSQMNQSTITKEEKVLKEERKEEEKEVAEGMNFSLIPEDNDDKVIFSSQYIQEIVEANLVGGKTKDIRIFERISQSKFRKFQLFINSLEKSFKYSYDGQTLMLVFPHPAHEAAGIYMNWIVTKYNLTFPQAAYNYPITFNGTADINLRNDKAYRPDASFQVRSQQRKSNNMVFEMANSEELQSLVQKLQNYIIFSDDILIAVGVKVWKNEENGSASMLFIVYLRQLGTNLPIFLHPLFRSFGNQALNLNEVNQTLTALQVEINDLQGTGFGPCDCDRPDIPFYMIEIPKNLLTCIDNFGTTFPADIKINDPTHRCILDLYKLQEIIWMKL